ncbi:MAG: hypothetical protein ACJA0H_002099, partial [Francisellaceae bacterium]
NNKETHMPKKLFMQMKKLKNSPPKFYPRDTVDKTRKPYGSIDVSAPYSFDGWEYCQDNAERFEVKQFQQIFDGINQHIQNPDYNNLEDIRLKLPANVMDAMCQMNELAENNGLDFNFSQTMIAAIVNMARTVAHNLPEGEKQKAFELLEGVGISPSNRNKSFFKQNSEQIKLIFVYLDGLYNRIESLHSAALRLFNKNKNYSPELIEKFASGDEQPNRWMISSAVTVIAQQDSGSIELQKMIASPEDFVLLWVMPLKHSAKMDSSEIIGIFQSDFSFTEDYMSRVINIIQQDQ